MHKPYALLLTGLISLAVSSLHANDKLKNLPADSWYTVPQTQLKSLCPSSSAFPGVQASGGCSMVTAAWGGGALDPVGKRMWVWGGGHGDYWGNEIYSFDVEALRWDRYTEPSTTPSLSQDPMADGKPVSRHTYDGLAYITHANRFFAFGGSMAGNGYGTEVTWAFDPKAKQWENKKPAGASNRPSANCCNFTGEYDAESRKVFMRDPNWLVAYDLDKNTWSRVMPWAHSWSAGKTVVDTKRRLLFTVGAGEFLVYDIAANRNVSADWKTTGGDALINGTGIGMAYDIKTDQLVGYVGGGVYALNMQSRKWTRMNGTGAPARPEANGTYGRFRYIPEDNVFILVNSAGQDVSFYKLSAGPGGSSAPTGVERGSIAPKVPASRGLAMPWEQGAIGERFSLDGRAGADLGSPAALRGLGVEVSWLRSGSIR